MSGPGPPFGDGAGVPWRDAVQSALYGPAGFYRRETGPAAHFRTSAHVSPAFATALVRLARAAGLTGVLDVGAGRGELVRALAGADPDLALHAVEVVGRPAGLADRIGWTTALPAPGDPGLDGVLVVANEWLDDVPCDAAVVRNGVWRLLLVDPRDGSETVGPPVAGLDADWLARWWPAGAEGDRAEVGRPRDTAWADLVRRVGRGVLLAADYGHLRAERSAGLWAGGTLAGYRGGRAVPPVPDGSCDITAHVAFDAVAAAGAAAGGAAGGGTGETRLVRQRDGLRALGLDAAPPAQARAGTDPAGYLAALSAAGDAAELTSPGGLGAFRWLVQSVRTDLPEALTAAMRPG